MASWTRRKILGVSAGSMAAVAAGLAGCSTWIRSVIVPSRGAPELLSLAPQAPREFRAAWVATVANIDWPSRKGLTTAQQQAEMHAILDQSVALRLNAIILQVRTSADALYASALEPWSEYLSGTQGQAPEPYYDPLAMWIDQAHSRGLELHAWFNPFRARQSSAKSALAGTHLGNTQPDWVKRYGDQLWIDPGEPAAADHTLAVFKDVLRRYDVDGIHIDDYFYPYPVMQKEDPKAEVDFPDQPAWQRYLDGGGTLARDDWRRSNVDALIARIYAGIREIKPWVRFGVSPFGLGKPELRPEGIAGFSQYHKLYANVERWLSEGWMDYLVPQLYWPRDQKEQAFVPLLDYWHRQNTQGRHVWAGLYTSRIDGPVPGAKPGWPTEEIVQQIAAVRERAPGSGHVHFSMVALMQNRQGLADALKADTYATAALVPACTWLEADAPAAPMAQLQQDSDGLALVLQSAPGSKPVVRWAVWLRYGAQWRFLVSAAGRVVISSSEAQRLALSGVVVSAIDRVGNESPRVGLVPAAGAL